MKWSCSHCVRATAVYADIFDFALTDEELVLWLLVSDGKKRYSGNEILRNARRTLIRSGAYWTLPGRTGLARNRKHRLLASKTKQEHARAVSRWLSRIPSVLLTGITGGLAMENTNEEDDIDLFFIVSEGTIWISRLLAICIVELISRRRRPGDTNVANAICLNMFVTVRALGLPAGERDIYASHEVLQMKPLFDRGGIYRRFLDANVWVKKFLPHAWKERYQMAEVPTSLTLRRASRYQTRKDTGPVATMALFVLRTLEIPAKIIQTQYMKGKQTSEVVTDDVLRFHPRDARPWVQRKFVQRCRQHKITLDKNFWAA